MTDKITCSGTADGPVIAPHPQVDILLSTFNGEQFLAEQLASISRQTYPEWQLLVRDDGSTDGTSSIVRTFRDANPTKVRIIEDGQGNLGSTLSFGRLLEQSTADYAMFCDQDDVWLPDKIVRTLDAMRKTETAHGRGTPVLTYSDLILADERLRILSDSFWSYQGLNPINGHRLNRLLLRNVVTGCTVMMNRALREVAKPIPMAALQHDWWVALVAATFGVPIYLEKPTALYRQHGGNVVGAKKERLGSYVAGLVKGFSWDGRLARATAAAVQGQAQALAERCREQPGSRKSEIIGAFLRMRDQNLAGRLLETMRFGFFRQDLVRTMVYIAFSSGRR